MDVIEIAFEVIDMRSFSNLWFWIALAVLWSSTSHWPMGVPHDMIYRARREGGQAEQDLSDLAQINARRVLSVIDHALLAVIGIGSFWLTVLATLAFYYDLEFAQALFLLSAPMTLVVWHSGRTARRVMQVAGDGDALRRALLWHRRVTQIVGMIAVLVTALYGTWQNFNTPVLH